ncbi:MAG: sel1 repeat family protein [Prevotellaceae bacterium]|nr:sel1 repeat family protein [Prevotellaceae bacterium]
MKRTTLGFTLLAVMLLTLSACQRKTDQSTPESAELSEMAETEDADAQYEQGMKLLLSYEPDTTEAVHLFEEAARQGNARARLAMGVMHFTGYAVDKDYKLAAEYMEDAANEGNLLCQMLVSICRGDGLGDGRDYSKVEEWLKTHEYWNSMCQYLLGLYHQNCTSIDDRYREALRWYRKSAGTMDMCACEADYPADVRRDAEKGDAVAQYYLGLSYEIGDSASRDYAEAARWYRKAAEQGLLAAQVMLGDCYFYGNGVRQSLKEAARWLRQAEEQFHAVDLVQLCQDSDIVGGVSISRYLS